MMGRDTPRKEEIPHVGQRHPKEGRGYPMVGRNTPRSEEIPHCGKGHPKEDRDTSWLARTPQGRRAVTLKRVGIFHGGGKTLNSQVRAEMGIMTGSSHYWNIKSI